MLLKELIEELESHIWEENEELEIHFVLNTEDDKEDDIDLELAGTTRTDYSDKTIIYIDLYKNKDEVE